MMGTATDDYLPGAFCEQANGRVLSLKCVRVQPVAVSMPADSTRQVFISNPIEPHR